jgi:hypothetical protein
VLSQDTTKLAQVVMDQLDEARTIRKLLRAKMRLEMTIVEMQ